MFLSFWEINKKTFSIYLQIILGIGLGIVMQVFGIFLSTLVGGLGSYIAIFSFVSSLAFITKIKALGDLSVVYWMTAFFGVKPSLEIVSIFHLLLLPLAIGFLFAYLLDTITTKFALAE